MITATRYHDFSCGHRVHGHESKCAHLHGHNYRVHFTVAATSGPRSCESTAAGPDGLDSIGRVLDFSAIKSRLCDWLERNWDHRFLLWESDPWFDALAYLDPVGTVSVPFNPTAENMARFLVEHVAPEVLNGTGVELITCVVEETRKCSASYSKPLFIIDTQQEHGHE